MTKMPRSRSLGPWKSIQWDDFLRGDRPKDIFRNSIVAPSLLASILSVKYVNSTPLNRIEQEFMRNGVNISRQTMSNWIINSSDRYFALLVGRMIFSATVIPPNIGFALPTALPVWSAGWCHQQSQVLPVAVL